MKIAIDYRLAASSNRGMARYCREIVNELFRLDKQNEYYLLTSVIPDDVKLPKNFKFVRLSLTNFILSEQFSIPAACRRLKPDVLWSPYNTFPVFLRKKTKLFVTIHDLIFFNAPMGEEKLYKRIGRLYRKAIVKTFSKHICSYFTVSEYSKSLIRNLLKLNCDGVITPNCLSPDFISLSEKYRENGKMNFFFTVSGDNPSKNLQFLINIFSEKLVDETLYIAGLGEKSEFRKYQTNKIIFLSQNISDEELVKLYSSCKAFIFPSLEEGFGIPIIEALCCHSKVISSNRTCLPEIVGNQGVLFDPTDENSLLFAIKQLDEHTFFYDITQYVSWKNFARLVLNEFIKQEHSK